jgi:mono/diheme cytochrome c family protein
MCAMGLLATTRTAALAGALVVLAGCGGGDEGGSSSSKSSSPGAKVFADAGCGTCHTLKAAGSSGTVGPNLDEVQPDEEKVRRQVTNGGGGMPSFRAQLTEQEISDVAEFVASSTRTATGGGPVAAGFKPDDTTLEDCEGQVEFKCYEQAFANVAYKDGPKAALDIFDGRIKQPGPIEADCHRIAHAIGAGSLSYFDGKIGQAFVAGRPSCTSGYYHGILERAFLGIKESELASASNKFCADPMIRKTEFIAYQCVHGLGHGLMIYTGYDLPLSLKTCDNLANEWDGRSCTGGVFMENIQSSYGVKSRWLKAKDLIYPCNAVAERDKYYCYDLVPGRVLPVYGHDFKQAIKWCRRSERGWVLVCFQGLGREASGFTRLDPDRTLAICKQAGNMAPACIVGASRDMVYTDAGPRRAKVFCARSPAATQGVCWEGIGSIMGSMHNTSAERKAACDQATTVQKLRVGCYRGSHVDGF